MLALDQGTTSSRAILYDRGGTIHSLVQGEFEQIFPWAGRVKHDPEEMWASQMSVAVEALSLANSPRDIAAPGITNQRETTPMAHKLECELKLESTQLVAFQWVAMHFSLEKELVSNG